MKTYKVIMPLQYTAIITPIAPRLTLIDGIISTFNLTGTYYDTSARLDALCKASEHIVKINDVWSMIGKDLYKASDEFARIHHLSKAINPMSGFKHIK